MEITSIKVFPVDEERLKAFATIVFDSCFVVRDLKIIKGNKGLFVAMPSKRCKDGTFKDMAHPLNSETRNLIEELVIKEYNEELKRNGTTPKAGSADDSPEDSSLDVISP